MVPLEVSRAQERDALAGKPRATYGRVPVRLVKEIKHALLVDVSYDSKKVCLYFTQHPVRSFRWAAGEWKERKASPREGEDALRVISADSWTSEYATRLPGTPYYGSFFADGQALCVGVPGVQGGNLWVVIDLKNAKRADQIDPYDPSTLLFSYSALNDRTLLGSGLDRTTGKTKVLVRAQLPSYRELQRVPFAWNRSPRTGRTETGIIVSVNRRAFAYGFDNNVVYRSADDLRVLWAQTTDPELMLWHVAISADGDLVVASVCEQNSPGAAEKYYVGVFDGKDGKELTRLRAEGTEAVAISPDRKLVAVGLRVPLLAKKSGTQPTVELFEIASGKRVATLIHDQFYGGGKEFLYAGVGVEFTPDGKYLITSGLNTKIWEIGRG